jgi:hypothetical protein
MPHIISRIKSTDFTVAIVGDNLQTSPTSQCLNPNATEIFETA